MKKQPSNKKKKLATTAKVKPITFMSAEYSDTEYESEQESGQLSRTLSQLSKDFKKQQKNFSKLIETLDFVSSQFEKLQKRIEGLVKVNKSMKEDIKQMKQNQTQLTKRVTQLEASSTLHKQFNNENHMIVTNLPKFNNDTNLQEVIIKIGEQVNCQVDRSDIVSVYQTENKKFNTYPLIVKMTKCNLKQKCIEFRKAKKQIQLNVIAPNLQQGDKNINFHHLIEKELAELLKKAKEAAKTANFKFVWFSKNCVLTRKDETSQIIRISNEIDLQKIKQ